MSKIIRFRGRKELTAEENLSKFIEFAKENTQFQQIKWDDDIWPIDDVVEKKLQSKTGKKVYFRSFDDKSKYKVKVPLNGFYRDFAKATFSEFIRINKIAEFSKIISVLTLLEKVLIELNKTPSVTQINATVFIEVTTFINNHYQYPWAYGRTLERVLTEIILPSKLTTNVILWKNTIPYDKPQRNDNVNKKQGSQKLPAINTILALADIHQNSQKIPDQLVTSFVSLAMFAPSRATEILTLPIDCITSASTTEGEIMGLKWRPLKDGQPITKFATSELSKEMATESILNLIELGKHARLAAAWYESNPNKLYMPERFEHLRGKNLTNWEMSQIIGKSTPFKHSSLRNKGVLESKEKTNNKSRSPHLKLYKNITTYTFSSFENWVLSRLTKNFPLIDKESNLKFSEALFTMPTNVLRPDGDNLEYLPTNIEIDNINNQLGNNPGGKTIFSRHSKKDNNGELIRITTHQFRHLLNTLAQSKYLSQELIAFWSGRKSTSQNDWYNHISQEAFIEAYLRLPGQTPELEIDGSLNEKIQVVSINNTIEPKDALKLELGAIHITRYGICKHDYSLTPCPKDKDCINCGEHLFTKGNIKQLEEAKYQLQLHEKALVAAKKALNDEELGAKRWIKLYEPKVARWKLAIRKLKNPNLKSGTLITLPPPEYSQTKVGLAIESKTTREI